MSKSIIFSLVILLTFSVTTYAGFFDFMEKSLTGAGDSAQSAQQAVGQSKRLVNPVQATASGSLVDVLVQQLGVTPTQAQGGAGAIFQAAKARMTEEAFNTVSQSVPGMDSLLAAAKQTDSSTGLPGGLAALAGDQAENLNTAASLAGTFQNLGLSSNMVSQFVPVMVDYVRQNGGEAAASLLSSALSGI